jgi:DNA primase
VLIAYDRDDAGERGAAKVAEVLMAQGIECFRVQFPKGMDANEYACKVQPPAKSLGLLLRKAVWLGKGQAPQAARGSAPERAAPVPLEVADCDLKPPAPPSTPAEVVTTRDHPREQPSLAASPAAEPQAAPPQAEIDGDTLRLAVGTRTWLVRGLPKVNPGASLKLNVRVQGADAALHVDSVDLYSARGRAVFAAQAAAELDGRSAANVSESLAREIARELGCVLLAVEQAITERERQASAPKQIVPTMTEAEHDAALALLQSPALIPRILADFAAVGLVGEDTNKLVGYLAAVSRKLDRPLGVVCRRRSKSEPPRRPKIEPGVEADFELVGCG